jgi:hypothetical protein
MKCAALKQSDLIQSLGWKDGKMEVKYRDDGAVFVYSGVSKSLYEALKRSPHPGEDWLRIRDSYDYQRVSI